MIKRVLLAFILAMMMFQGCAEKSKIIYIDPKTNQDINRTDSLYEVNRKEELAKLIQEPIVPMKTPDKVLRVLMLPYVDKNNLLQTSNFIFVKVDDGKWIIGDYLNQEVEISSNKNKKERLIDETLSHIKVALKEVVLIDAVFPTRLDSVFPTRLLFFLSVFPTSDS